VLRRLYKVVAEISGFEAGLKRGVESGFGKL
jgi:hypothetical protein